MSEWSYQPAADQELPPGQRLRSVRRETGVTGAIAHYGWGTFVRIYLRAYHRLQIEGRENLPADAPFVVIANHSSHLDALTIATALPWRLRRKAYPIAAGDTFFESHTTAFFSAIMLNALPMWRKRTVRHALDQLRQRMLEEPCGYILFPEGTRSRTGELGTFRSGIGMLIAGTGVPVIPCCLSGAHDAWPPTSRVPRPRPIRIRIGKALLFPDTPNERTGWNDVAKQLEAAVLDLRI